MSVSVFDKLAVSRPVNRAAANAVTGGAGYEPRKGWCPTQVHSDVPLPTRPFPTINDPTHDLTGRTFGRLAVIGLAADRNSRWVVRCQCGGYEMRTSAALKSQHSDARHLCSRCEHTVKLRERGSGRFQHG